MFIKTQLFIDGDTEMETPKNFTQSVDCIFMQSTSMLMGCSVPRPKNTI